MNVSIRALTVAAFLLASCHVADAAGLTRDDFTVRNTADLMRLCEASEGEHLYQAAIGFCHGFMVGAYRFYEATLGQDTDGRLFCLPSPQPSRQDLIARWQQWVHRDSARLNMPAVESPFRFLSEAYPCENAAAKGGPR